MGEIYSSTESTTHSTHRYLITTHAVNISRSICACSPPKQQTNKLHPHGLRGKGNQDEKQISTALFPSQFQFKTAYICSRNSHMRSNLQNVFQCCLPSFRQQDLKIAVPLQWNPLKSKGGWTVTITDYKQTFGLYNYENKTTRKQYCMGF